jgi:5-methylcytosine-specific restriction enzyme subunit McrC
VPLPENAKHHVGFQGIDELLVSQLNGEVQDLIARGLFRGYRRTSERVGTIRGRIDLDRLVLDGGTVAATVPCVFHARTADTFLNQVVMAGLRLAASMTSVMELRRESLRLASQMEGDVSRIRLDEAVVDRAIHAVNRLTDAYTPALSIIRLLIESKGIVLEGASTRVSLPGFMFDMNAFFQLLMSRFLRENLPGCQVRDEHALKGELASQGDALPTGRVCGQPSAEAAEQHPLSDDGHTCSGCPNRCLGPSPWERDRSGVAEARHPAPP